MAAGLIDSRVDSSIFGTSKFTKDEDDSLKENIFSNIDEMISDTLDNKDADITKKNENDEENQDDEDEDEDEEDLDDEDEEDEDEKEEDKLK